MSIGSVTAGGVSHVLVRNLTIDGAQNGIRIKSDPSRGGLVQDGLAVTVGDNPNGQDALLKLADPLSRRSNHSF